MMCGRGAGCSYAVECGGAGAVCGVGAGEY